MWSLLQHEHHPVSFTVATYLLYHYYLHLLPNIHILELHERVCLKIEVWNPVLFYVYSLSHHEYNHTYEHHQTSATLSVAMSNHNHNQTVEARHAMAFKSGDTVE